MFLSHVHRVTQYTVMILLPFCAHSAVYILLGAGGLMMVVGFFGCFGAVRESQCLLSSVSGGFIFMHSSGIF